MHSNLETRQTLQAQILILQLVKSAFSSGACICELKYSVVKKKDWAQLLLVTTLRAVGTSFVKEVVKQNSLSVP